MVSKILFSMCLPSCANSLKNFFIKNYGVTLLMQVSDFDVYLDSKKIVENNLNLEEVQNKSAQYLLQINGIADAVTATALQQQVFVDSIRSKVSAGFHASRCGDIIFLLKPNWLEGYHKGTTHGSPYMYDTHVPLLWWGYNVQQGNSSDVISITQIAPTISKLLKIPVPNGCASKPIQFIK